MDLPDYSLPLTSAQARSQARRWLLLGVVALGVAGVFAGLLANTLSPFFYKALAVHVDLSVLVWFLTMAAMFFTLAAGGRGLPLVGEAAFICFALGAALIVLSAFTGGDAYMSNYIPVIHHPVFFLGLSLILCGIALSAANLLVSLFPRTDASVQHFGVVVAACIVLIALACFARSARDLPAEMIGQVFYEYAFWAGGHVLQFAHTQLMMVAWLWLAGAAGLRLARLERIMPALFIIGLLAVIRAPFIYYEYDLLSDESRDAFTWMMISMNGIAPLVLGAFIIASFTAGAKGGAALPKICLLMSILLFAVGGGIGYLIRGSNVTVPAHYHGSIVGVTLAFMGVAYLLLPTFGWRDVARSKLALAQPIVYGGGQLCWMAGMAILGAHGVPRKTPGSADTVGALAAFLKHGGDGLALIGGLLFVFIVLRAVCSRQSAVSS